MSTKSTIKGEHEAATGLGFHLYSDWLDECSGVDVVHLRLDGVPFKAACDAGGRSVTVTIPRDMAEKLGLVVPCPVSTETETPEYGSRQWRSG
jgi:hypothetical protein